MNDRLPKKHQLSNTDQSKVCTPSAIESTARHGTSTRVEGFCLNLHAWHSLAASRDSFQLYEKKIVSERSPSCRGLARITPAVGGGRLPFTTASGGLLLLKKHERTSAVIQYRVVVSAETLRNYVSCEVELPPRSSDT